MKPTHKIFNIFLFLVMTSSITISASYAQTAKAIRKMQKDSIIKKAVDDRTFTFTAQTATPLGGAVKQLTSTYDLTISKDTVIAFLPYFGRAYTVPLDPSKGGIQFTENNAGYSASDRKKGGWDIVIKVKQQEDALQLSLTVFQNGSASLLVNSANRDPISFDGFVTPNKKKK
jgi:hypothetical protein